MTRCWKGFPVRMPHALPPPIPELAFLFRVVLQQVGWSSSERRDFVLSYLMHVSVLRRLPFKRILYNDVLFRLKTGPILKSPLSVRVSDKEFVKHYIAHIVGEEYNIPTLAILRLPVEIDAYEFPNRCIIKPTHASGEFIYRRSGEALDLERIKAWLKLDFSEQSHEANYRPLVPKIIVEAWALDEERITEFKFYCVEGKARAINAISGRFTDYSVVYFDTNWNELPYTGYEAGHGKFERPQHLAEMISLAERLAEGFFFVRIDFYYDGTTIKCGEITNCPGAGLNTFRPREAELAHSRLLFSNVTNDAWDNFFGEL
jgi:hypothetical protein